MERYVVAVGIADSANYLRLIVPWPSSSIVDSIVEEIIDRANGHGRTLCLETHDCTLHLGASVDGPILCGRDLLADVIRGEEVFAHFQPRVGTTTGESQHAAICGSPPFIAIRIITPAVARDHARTSNTIQPCLTVPITTTFKQLYDQVAAQLHIPEVPTGFTEVDLHTHEMPIHPSAFHLTLKEGQIQDLVHDGVFDLFAVRRHAEYQGPVLGPMADMSSI